MTPPHRRARGGRRVQPAPLRRQGQYDVDCEGQYSGGLFVAEGSRPLSASVDALRLVQARRFAGDPRGQGAYVWDAAGRRYLDGIGGLWCVNIGYGRQEMAQAIADQVVKLSYSNTFVDCTNEPAAELAAKLAQLAPGSSESRRLFAVGILRERHRGSARSFLSLASRRTEPACDSVAIQLLSRLDLSRHDARQPRGRSLAAFQVYRRPGAPLSAPRTPTGAPRA